jgi:hypothetical protein
MRGKSRVSRWSGEEDTVLQRLAEEHGEAVSLSLDLRPALLLRAQYRVAALLRSTRGCAPSLLRWRFFPGLGVAACCVGKRQAFAYTC